VTNLEKVDHIVVLMLENRSFDHMLGYLSLEGGRGDVDGLRGEFANEHDGRSYPIHHLDSTSIADDPDHSASSVDLQIGGGAMDGFVTSFAGTLSRRGVEDGDPARVMGYYNAADVPVYDHLAREFAVCDRWFSSVPGATWPNRLYAICGRAAGSRYDLPHNLPPLYNQPSFVRHLDAHGIMWRWYSFEGGTLRFADAHYALGHHDRFAFFSKTNLNWKARLEQDRYPRGELPRGRRPGHAAVGLLDRPEFQQLQPHRLPAQRRPRTGGHQGRPRAGARHLPRAAPGHEDTRSRSHGLCLGTKRPPGRGRTSRGSKPKLP